MKSYAVLFVPEFQLQATLRHTPELMEQPVALLEVDGTKSRVQEMNAPARTRQVVRGMTPTQALARCAELHLLHANPGHNRAAQEILLQIAETLSPFLESTLKGVVTVELPAERIVEEEDLREKCVVSLRLLGLEIGVGIASTPDLALLAARAASPVRIVRDEAEFLKPLLVEVLEPSAELREIFSSWGIHTIGQLRALPQREMCERLGPEALHLCDKARGGQPRPLQLVKPREFYAEQTDLEHAVELLEPLLFLLRRFLEQIAGRLAQTYYVVGKLRLTLRFEAGESYRRVFTIPQPTRDVDLLFRLLHTHLENFTSTSPIVSLELAAQPVRATAEQFDLLERGLRDPHQLAETLGRLQALLGAERVGTPALESSHHPDAFKMQAYDFQSEAREQKDELLFGVPWLRFRPPIPAQIILNDVQPAFLYSARCTGPIMEVRGPWRIEGQWWEPRHWLREEWDVMTEEGTYRLVRQPSGWFLDGIYA